MNYSDERQEIITLAEWWDDDEDEEYVDREPILDPPWLVKLQGEVKEKLKVKSATYFDVEYYVNRFMDGQGVQCFLVNGLYTPSIIFDERGRELEDLTKSLTHIIFGGTSQATRLCSCSNTLSAQVNMSTTRTREALEDFAFHYALEYAMELFDGHPSWERSYHQIRSIGDLFSALPNGDSQDVKKVAKIKRFYKAMQVVGSKTTEDEVPEYDGTEDRGWYRVWEAVKYNEPYFAQYDIARDVVILDFFSATKVCKEE